MKSDKKISLLKNQINCLKLFIGNAGLNLQKRRQYLNRPDQDFTRKRKLDFSITATLILGLLKKV